MEKKRQAISKDKDTAAPAGKPASDFPYTPAPVVVSSVAPEALGRCRRHAPTMSGWPATFEGDWCGDHKLDEQRV